MNWYKMSQQKSFPFFDDIPQQKQTPLEERKDYKDLTARTPHILKELAKQCSNLKELEKALKTYKFDFVTKDNSIIVNVNGVIYVLNSESK